MGTPYNGASGNVGIPAAVNIASSTNANPIVVTTATAHGMLNNDYVDVSLHQVNTNANGIWPITYVSPTSFSIPATGNGVGGATGTAQPVTMTSNVGLNPANGDALNASTWIPGMACPQDRTAFLAKNLGAYKVVGTTLFNINNDTGTTWCSGVPTATGTWSILMSGVSGYPILIPALASGDFITVQWMGTVIPGTASGVTRQKMAISYASSVPGVVPANIAFQKIFGTGVDFNIGSNINTPFSLSGVQTFGGGNVYVALSGFQLGSVASGGFTLIGDTNCIITQYRATGWPQ